MTVSTRFATVEEAIEEIREGRMVVVVDDEDRENEGDLTIAAQFATPEAINFMAMHARGLICLCLTEERCDELGLRQMAENNETPLQTALLTHLLPPECGSLLAVRRSRGTALLARIPPFRCRAALARRRLLLAHSAIVQHWNYA